MTSRINAIEGTLATRQRKSNMLEASIDGRTVILRVRTEIDFSSADVLEDAMRNAAASDGTRVVVDLSTCAYVDSSCLAVLVRQHRTLGARLAVVVPRDARTRRIFKISGLLGSLPIVESVAEATDGGVGFERIVQ